MFGQTEINKESFFSLEFTAKERVPLRSSAFLSGFLALLGLGTALGSRAIYDHVLSSHSMESLTAIGIALVFILTVDTLFRIIRHRWTEAVSEHYDTRISRTLFSRLLKTRVSFMARSSVATSLFREFEAVRDLRGSVMSTAVVDTVSILVFLVAIGIMTGWLVVIPAIGLLSIILSFIGQKRIETLSLRSQATSVARQALLQESVYGIEDVKLCRAETFLANEMSELTAAAAEDGAEIRHLSSLISSLVGGISGAVTTGVTVFGAMLAIEGHITTGTMIAASILSGRTMGPCNALAAMAMKIGRARSAEKTVKMMAEAPQENSEGITSASGTGVAVRALTYHYPGREIPALDRVEFSFEPGTVTALVGPRGGGKSTLGKLLAGLEICSERDSGSILLGGIPVSQYAPESLRKIVGLCPQDGMLFSRSIIDNIRMARPEASDEETIRASILACAHDWIIRTPGGYGAPVREGGRSMSGGERHSIALARLFLANPSVVFMDEPTAHFDIASTVSFISGMREWMKNRTVIIASHKPEIIMLSSKTILLAGGRIASIKTPREMLAALGFSMRTETAS